MSERRSLMDDMAVDLPEGTHNDVAISHFDSDHPMFALANMQYGARAAKPGTYTMITRRGTLWMSDTTAERRDHLTVALKIDQIPEDAEGRVLIGGLGLGMILRVALLTPTVKHVDVIEIDPDVIALVGPAYMKMAEERGITLVIHEADLMTKTWPKGTRWDVAWFDIWPTLCTDDLAEHGTLARRYTRRTGWYGCWGHDLLLSYRRRERNSPWGGY